MQIKKIFLKVYLTLILALMLILGVLNTAYVEFNYIFGTAEIPLGVIIIVIFILGGFLTSMHYLFKVFIMKSKLRKLENKVSSST